MAEARAEVRIRRSADDVWNAVGDFADVSWIAGADGCRLVGEHDRVVTMGDMEFTERLLEQDDAARSVTYSVVGGSIELDHHEATITVTPDGTSAMVTWDVSTDDAMVDALRGGYQHVLDALATTLEAEAGDRRYVWVLRCPCGTVLDGADEDEIVDRSLAHLSEAHPDMSYEREHVLFMAQRFVRT